MDGRSGGGGTNLNLVAIQSPNNYLSNYGNKRYLKVSNEVEIEINEEKINNDSRWDGLHGVITNAKNILDMKILAQYNNLWNVENAFRITKYDLKVRPVFHWKPTRARDL
ncbi:MAG: hypothetical protein L6420_02660 [Elusimicrobia bacterium]|nr:hypothetical protein [Elusimicrobiota bacterium]